MSINKVKKRILMSHKFEDAQKKERKRIISEDEIESLPEYVPESPSDEEQEENNNNEMQNKYKEKKPKQIEKPKKGIIKM